VSIELRRVPANWEHPKKEGCYVEMNEYLNTPENLIDDEPPVVPNRKSVMDRGDWYQLYEDISMGTPLSPAFVTKEELKNWLIENKDFHGWKWRTDAIDAIIKHKYAIRVINGMTAIKAIAIFDNIFELSL